MAEQENGPARRPRRSSPAICSTSTRSPCTGSTRSSSSSTPPAGCTSSGHRASERCVANPAGPPRGGRLDRGVQHRAPTLHQPDAQPSRLRARPSHRPRQPPRRGSRVTSRVQQGGTASGCAGEAEAAAPPLHLLEPRRAGYEAAPPASRVATAIAAATALRAALDPGASATPGAATPRAGHQPAHRRAARSTLITLSTQDQAIKVFTVRGY